MLVGSIASSPKKVQSLAAFAQQVVDRCMG
jgi:hypothetical protein